MACDQKPSWVAFDGGGTTTIHGHFAVQYGGGSPSSHDHANTHLENSADSQGALVFARDTSYFTARNNEIGPACCSSDGIGIEIRDQGDPVPRPCGARRQSDP